MDVKELNFLNIKVLYDGKKLSVKKLKLYRTLEIVTMVVCIAILLLMVHLVVKPSSTIFFVGLLMFSVLVLLFTLIGIYSKNKSHLYVYERFSKYGYSDLWAEEMCGMFYITDIPNSSIHLVNEFLGEDTIIFKNDISDTSVKDIHMVVDLTGDIINVTVTNSFRRMRIGE